MTESSDQEKHLDNFVLRRLRADAAHAIAIAEAESAVPHAGLRGRLREIIIGNLLAPWLPPFCKCVTGMMIEPANKQRRSTQDDIFIINTSIAPPIFATSNGAEGLFLTNSVLLRIEVKSKITSEGVNDFLDASLNICGMEFHQQAGCKTKFEKPINTLIGFKSDLADEWDADLNRLRRAMKKRQIDPLKGVVSSLCVVERGYWYLKGFEGNQRSWVRLDVERPEDRLAWLVGHISNMAYKAHAEREGRDPSLGLEAGIGFLIGQMPIYLVPSEEEDGE